MSEDNAKVYNRGIIIVSLIVMTGFAFLDWRQDNRATANQKLILDAHQTQLAYIAVICGGQRPVVQANQQSMTIPIRTEADNVQDQLKWQREQQEKTDGM